MRRAARSSYPTPAMAGEGRSDFANLFRVRFLFGPPRRYGVKDARAPDAAAGETPKWAQCISARLRGGFRADL